LGNRCFQSSGIGLYIALHLVRRGAKVYIAARSEEKAEHAIVRMEEEGMGEHPGQLVWLPIDLTDPHRARAAAEWFLKRESRLDILGTWVAKRPTALLCSFAWVGVIAYYFLVP